MTRRTRLAASAALAAALALAPPGETRAASDPDIQWWTIETPHFRVHYWSSLEPIAERVAALAEDIHDRITAPLGHAPGTTEIVLTDDTDGANGSAIATPFNTIRMYVNPPDDLTTLSDYDDWLLALLTHEYTHIVHTDNISGAATVINAILGKVLAPNQLQPRWVLEGLATAYETYYTSGGRVRASLFDAYLRADYLEDSFPTLDQISNPAMRWPQANLWYLYGSRFLAWIAEVYGRDVLRAVATDYGSWAIPLGINRSIKRATGRTYVELYDGFLDYLKRRYRDQLDGVTRRGVREGVRVTAHGRAVSYPRWVPSNGRWGSGCDATPPGPECPPEQLVYHRDDFSSRTGVYALSFDAKGRVTSDEIVTRVSGDTSSTFGPDGALFFASTAAFKNNYYRYDLFRLAPHERADWGWEPGRKRLTEGLRAHQPDVSPDGKRIVFRQMSKGTSWLQIADLAPDGTLSGARDLVQSARYEQAYTPRFSPDGKKVAYSAWTRGGYRDVRVVDVASGVYEELQHDRALDIEPAWSGDGRLLYFSSDRTGIYNVYAWDVAKRELRQVTNTRGMAVMPAPSPDGKSLAYVGYGKDGYDLYRMPLDESRFLEPLPYEDHRPAPPPDAPYRAEFKKRRYDPLRTLAPRSYLVNFGPGRYSGFAFNVSTQGADVAGNHSFSLNMTVDPGAPHPDFSAAYNWGQTQVDLGFRAFVTSSPRDGSYFVNGVDTRLVQRSYGLTVGLSYPIRHEFFTQRLGLSYSAAATLYDAPKHPELDPYSVPPGRLDPTYVGVARGTYAFDATEGGFDQAGGTGRGFYFDVALDYAGPVTGSQLTYWAAAANLYGYATLPWGKHVVAGRASFATAGGDYAGNGVYSSGGYDVQSFDLLKTLTSSAFNGAFVLRGYPAAAFVGKNYVLVNLEYRAPLFRPDRGLSTLPVYLRRVDLNAFVDFGGAFNRLDPSELGFFRNDSIIDSPDLHSSVGFELWFGATLGYVLNQNFRLGFAHGFDRAAIQDGKLYFVSSTAF